MRSRRIFQVGDEAIAAGVPDALRACPFIVLPWGPAEAANLYLQEQWLGRCSTSEGKAMLGKRSRGVRYRPLPSTVQEAANRLANLLCWCADHTLQPDGKAIDAIGLTEADIDRYASHMESGRWSSDGKRLSRNTVAQRQVTAIGFRQWAAAKGLAAQAVFSVREHKVQTGTRSGGTRDIIRRSYEVVRRQDPSTVLFPTVEEVRAGLATITDVGLLIGAKLILFCGLRASEVCEIEISDVTAGRRHAGSQHFISVLGKGRKRRDVEIDYDLLQDIGEFQEFERAIRAHKFRRNAGNRLLVSERQGRPYSYRTLWAAFRTAIPGSSPHLGRHWYAVMYLLKAWKREEQRRNDNAKLGSLGSHEHLLSLDLIRLKENLGHRDLKTTEVYLVALRQFIDKSEMSLSFQRMISLSVEEDRPSVRNS